MKASSEMETIRETLKTPVASECQALVPGGRP